MGKEAVENLSRSMRGWYGTPIPMLGLPGSVYACGDGDFCGPIRAGGHVSLFDYLCCRYAFRVKMMLRHAARRQYSQLNAGFSGLADLLTHERTGRRDEYQYQKTASSSTASSAMTLWDRGASPAAGASGSAAPGGRAPTSVTAGAFGMNNPPSGEQSYIMGAYPKQNADNNSLMLYDRIFDVAKTMNSTATEAVTGVPTRYQSTTPGADDYAGNNFLFIETLTALAATGHTWSVCLYTNQAGTAGQTLPAIAGNASSVIDRFDMPLNKWFCDLAANDTGIKALTQMQCGALVATGAIDFVIGHPLAIFCAPLAGLIWEKDFIFGTFAPIRIFDSACMALLEMPKVSGAVTTYSGDFWSVHG